MGRKSCLEFRRLDPGRWRGLDDDHDRHLVLPGGSGPGLDHLADHAVCARRRCHRRQFRPAQGDAGRPDLHAGRFGAPDPVHLFWPDHTVDAACLHLPDRQRHGAEQPVMAGLGRRHRSPQQGTGRRRAQFDGLQPDPQRRPGDRRHHRRRGRCGGGLRGQRRELYRPDRRAGALEAGRAGIDLAARIAGGCHGRRPALCRHVAQHRQGAGQGRRLRLQRRRGAGAAAAGGTRRRQGRRPDLRHHAWRLRHRRRRWCTDQRAAAPVAVQRDDGALGLRRLRRLRLQCRRQPPCLADVAWPACRRRLLGDRPFAFQRHGADGDTTLGGRPGAVGLSDRDLRRHRARQLDLGRCRRRAWRRDRADRGQLRHAGRRRHRPAVAAAATSGAQPRPAQPLQGTAPGTRPEAAQRPHRHHDRIHHPR